MNYQKIYNQIIQNRIDNKPIGYTENHHILPKSLGGSDNKDNLVKLTAREHFICHLLLTKVYKKGTIEWIKMFKALHMMMFRHSDNQERYMNSHFYKYFRESFSIAQSLNQSGKGNSQYNTVWIFNEKLEQNQKIKPTNVSEFLSNGWKLGRIIDWNKYKQRKYEKQLNISLKNKVKQEKLQKDIELYTQYYHIYNKYGWKEFVEQTEWKYSKSLLVMRFKKLVKEFKPQNGKKRGVN